jgi:hypothetical protein
MQTRDDSGSQLHNWSDAGDDREEECEDEGAQLDDEATLGWANGVDGNSQSYLHVDHNDSEREIENEHGGDIQDEPHDATDEGNDEPFLGWGEQCSQGPKIGAGLRHDPAVQCLDATADPNDAVNEIRDGYLQFDGDGCAAARAVLRNLRAMRPDVPQEYIGGWCAGDHHALHVDGLAIRTNKGREQLDPDERP